MTATVNSSAQNQALATTLSVLKILRYSSGIEVLEHGMQSKSSAIRTACLQGLVARGGAAEAEIVLRYIDRCGTGELDVLSGKSTMLVEAVEVGLTSRDPVIYQGALLAIAKLQLNNFFHQLVRVANDPREAQQLVATELILRLSKGYGQALSRGDRKQDTKRVQLLNDLYSAMDKSHDHVTSQIIDSWLYASTADDSSFHRVLLEASKSHASSLIVRHIERSHHKEVLQLAASLIWNKSTTNTTLEWLAHRADHGFLAAIGEIYQKTGINAQLRKNVSKEIQFQFLSDNSIYDPRLTPAQRCALVGVLSQSNRPTDEVLRHVVELMELEVDEIQPMLAEIVQNLKKLNPDVGVIALSDCMDAPDIESYEPPPWKDSLRKTLEKLLAVYPTQSADVKAAIAQMLSDYTCDYFMEKLEDWPRAHLIAYARLTKLAKPNHVEFLKNEVQARSFTRRLRGIQAIRLFGAEGPLWEFAVELVDDENQQVQVAAILAIADGKDRAEAIEVLRPLLTDGCQAVINAASSAIESLGGFA